MNASDNKSAQHGFTLIELMIVVIMIGIISMIAVPAYQEYSRKARRSEALATIAEVATAQEKFYSENLRYAASIDALPNFGADPYITPSGDYSVTTDTTSTYRITANAIGRQAADTKCLQLRLFADGSKTPADCW